MIFLRIVTVMLLLTELLHPVVMQGMLQQAMDGAAQHVSDTEVPIEGAKTTLHNPMFQQEADDVSDVEELH